MLSKPALLYIAAIAAVTVANAAPAVSQSVPAGLGQVQTNEDLISAITPDPAVDLTDAKAVFRLVFERLPEEPRIYPTENYYYFTLDIAGRTLWGSIALFASDRDRGVLHFGYSQKVDERLQPCFPLRGGSGAFTELDGVTVGKVSEFAYAVTFEGSTRIFRLSELDLNPPRSAQLAEDEVYIGPSFDESGLQFHLVFNETQDHFYWVLNEDAPVPEHFLDYTEDMVIGERTEFAFYLDRENNRKILIGVDGLNVLHNNWYDGPFDQLPDNYIKNGLIRIQPYFERAYPDAAGQINEFGYYNAWPGTRIAVSPYLIYFDRSDLANTVDVCRTQSETNSPFYACITQQIFVVPEQYRNCADSGQMAERFLE